MIPLNADGGKEKLIPDEYEKTRRLVRRVLLFHNKREIASYRGSLLLSLSSLQVFVDLPEINIYFQI